MHEKAPLNPAAEMTDDVEARGYGAEAIRNMQRAHRAACHSGVGLDEARFNQSELALDSEDARALVESIDITEKSFIR
jgi:hypothetical protein